MNHARLDVALQGVAHAARAAQIAGAYANERVQGRRSDGSPALLSDHADVQRMLDEQASLAIGARAMCHVACRDGKGGTPGTGRLSRHRSARCSVPKRAFCAADLGIQILGGYGYLNEYHVGQVWRDARITSIYEGANGLHERSLSTRGLKGQGADQFADLIADLVGATDDLSSEMADWVAWRNRMRTGDRAEIDAHAFVQFTARLLFKACWCKCRAVASFIQIPNGSSVLRSVCLVREQRSVLRRRLTPRSTKPL